MTIALRNVRYWPLADIAITPPMSAFGGKADTTLTGLFVRL